MKYNKFNFSIIGIIVLELNTSIFSYFFNSSASSEDITKADIVFMCSTNEAFGRVTVEGMMSGALVVGKDCAATSEIIDNGRTGILYKDSKELVECIKYAIENKEESRKIAKNGQVFAKKLFTAEKNANKIIKIYKQLNNQEETWVAQKEIIYII